MSQNSRLPARPGRSRPASMIESPMNSLAHFSIANANATGETDRKTKRRSLLPQFSRKVSDDATTRLAIAEETNEVELAEDEHTRRSGSETSRETIRPSAEGDRGAGRRTAIDEDRRAMPPPASKLSRPTSMIPPRGTSMSKLSRGHASSTSKEKELDPESARADSLAALTGSPPKAAAEPPALGGGIKRTGSTRLPQSPRPGMPSIPSRTTSARPAESSVRTNTGPTKSATNNSTSIAEKRSSIAKQRPQSIVGAPSGQDAVSTPTSPLKSQVTGRGRPASHLPPPKPAFNTFQQHYSPAKQSLPKPALPSSKPSRSAPVAPDDEPVSLDVAKQQLELLQLSLLHQSSAQCTGDYTASAKRKLGRKHTKLRKEYESIRATELVHQRALNLAALESWCADPAMLVENLQILSLVYSDLEALTEEGSRHHELVKIFESWSDGAQDLTNFDFVQPLPEEWHNAHSSMAVKLRSIQRNLGVLRPPEHSEDPSALEMVLKGCKTLVDGLLAELDLMIKLEKEILARERTKVEEQVRAVVLDDLGMSATGAQQWVPAWGRVS